MIVFGGFIGGERTNEVVLYNFQTNYWTKIEIPEESPQPCARSGHAACLANGEMYVFGGKNDDGDKMNDLWKFDYTNQTWTEIHTDPEGFKPEPRSGHTMNDYGDFLVVFGGIFEVTKELNDCVVFSLKQQEWICIHQEHQSPRKATDSPMRTTQKPNLLSTDYN